MTVIIATDFIDGLVARRLHTASTRGAIIDVACDSIVIITACVIMGMSTPCYFILLGFIIASLLSWGIYSFSAGCLIYSPVGKLNGIVCYIVMLAGTTAHLLSPPGSGIRIVLEISALTVAIVILFFSTCINIVGLYRKVNNL